MALFIDTGHRVRIGFRTFSGPVRENHFYKDGTVATKPSKTTTRKSTRRKASAKAAASGAVKKKRSSSKKAAAKKTAAKKTASKNKPPKKTAGSARKQAAAVKKATTAARSKPPKTGAPKTAKTVKGKPLNKRELKKFQKLLLELRERLQGDILFLTTDNLHRAGRETGADLSGSAQHSADHGTDNFDREFALSLASTEQDVLYEVDEALMRIEEGTYGVCEMTGVQIERARLEVIPYTRYSVQAQTKMEQSRAKYRPFAQNFRGW